jgi:polysaccharide export outer membrane protein
MFTMINKTLQAALYLFVFAAFSFSFAVYAGEGKDAVKDDVKLASAEVEGSESPDSIVEEDGADSYVLGVDDVLKIVVYGEDKLSGKYKVGSSGTISFPLLDDINVAGKMLNEVEALIEAKLADGYLKNPSVSIEVESYRSFYILGEVRAPGSYSYKNNINVLKAVAVAGGFTYRANKKHVRILKTRKDGSDIYEEMPVNAAVEPGDIILVKERFF